MPRGNQSPVQSTGAFLLGDWVVEPDLNQLTLDGHRLHLELKVMEVLVYLACHGSRVVTRQQLVDGVWNGRLISDNTLTHAIAELRRALSDDAGHPTYIQTVHRRGYRLLKPVTDLEGLSPVGFGRPSRFRILVDDRNVQLREGDNLIGRLPEAALCIESAQVSRRHARIIVSNNEAHLEDLGSKNGTLLNGRPFERRERLNDGDRIFLGEGTVTLQFLEAGSFAPTDPPDDVTLTDPPFEA